MNNYLSNDSGYLFSDNEELLSTLKLAIEDLRYDIKKIKSKLFNIEEVVKKSSANMLFPLIEQVYHNEWL